MTHVPQDRPFVGDGEILLCVYQMDPAKGDFIGETHGVLENFATPRDALVEIDECARVIRFNTQTLKGEDVSEALADAWLKGWYGDPSCDHPPPLVESSQSYKEYCEDFYNDQ